MSKSNVCENKFLKLALQNIAWTLVGDAAGLLPSAAAGNLYISLHTADPGEAGLQTTSECAYAAYARVAVVRSSGGWTVTNNQGTNVAAVTFPQNTGAGGEVASFFGIGTASSGGSGDLLYSGDLLGPEIVFTVDPATDVFTSTAHGLADGQACRFRNRDGNLPTGVDANTQYFVRDQTANTFKVALTPGGSAINITAAGDGTNMIRKDNFVAIGTNIAPQFSAGTLVVTED